MKKREHAWRSETAQLQHIPEEKRNGGLDAKTAPVDPRPFTQSQRVAPPQQTTAVPERATLSRRNTARNLREAVSDRRASIAKTHADLLALKSQGTRSYIEFSVTRSKHFQTVGPLAVQLRKADMKHSYYDLRLTVNGRQLEKRHVNLYEPVWITVDEHVRPLEFVVNGISRNQISGYLSQPKNRNSRLAER
jgi:hypothetical protein